MTTFNIKYTRQFIGLLGFIMLVFFQACSNESAEVVDEQKSDLPDGQVEVTSEQFKLSEMHLVHPEKRAFPASISTTGVIDVPPRDKSVVFATTGGYIKTSNLMEGDFVRKGQVVASIDNPELVTMQQEYLELTQDLNYLGSELERQKLMYEEKITAKKNYLKAQSEYNTTKARHAGLKKQLSLFNVSPTQASRGNFSSTVNIYAPTSGYITKVHITKGSYVAPSTEIMEIVNSDNLQLELTVYEKDVLQIKKDQRILFKIPEMDATYFEAKVHLIGQAIDENRTVRVYGKINDNRDATFLPGMFIEADIVTEEKSVISLPETAVAEMENTYFVLKLNSKDAEAYTFEQLEVEVGNTKNGFTEIKTKIDTTAQFLDKGAYELIQ